MKRHFASCFCTLTFAYLALGDGVPEPGVLLYGSIRSGNTFLTTGNLRWTFAGPSGQVIAVSTPIRSLLGGVSYRLRVPFESVVGGSSASLEAFARPLNTASFFSANVSVTWVNNNSYPASAVGQNVSFNFGPGDHGTVVRVDLSVTVPNPQSLGDADSDGLPDDWEARYGLSSHDAADALLDSDGDGMTNLAECLAGTNPTDPLSNLRFTQIAKQTDATILLTWTSEANRVYLVQHSETLFGPYSSIESNIVATPPDNQLSLREVSGNAWFYRILLQSPRP